MTYKDTDYLLIDLNSMYLSVYSVMLIEIIFFYVFIRVLNRAIEEESLNNSELQQIYDRKEKFKVQTIFSNLKCILLSYAICVLPLLLYMTITYIVSNRNKDKFDDNLDDYNRYH